MEPFVGKGQGIRGLRLKIYRETLASYKKLCYTLIVIEKCDGPLLLLAY